MINHGHVPRRCNLKRRIPRIYIHGLWPIGLCVFAHDSVLKISQQHLGGIMLMMTHYLLVLLLPSTLSV